jgi:hypothetical protein
MKLVFVEVVHYEVSEMGLTKAVALNLIKASCHCAECSLASDRQD